MLALLRLIASVTLQLGALSVLRYLVHRSFLPFLESLEVVMCLVVLKTLMAFESDLLFRI
jgi:hypothetical protein